MSGKFHNQVAVVTGASTGIGFAMARGLIAEGAKRVYITGRSAGTLEAAVAELGDKAVAVLSDVSQQAGLDGAAIVLTASICSSNGMEGLSLYNASKAAVRSFARTWANELKDRKIRANVLSPGFTRTPLMDNGLKMSEIEIAALREHVERITPLGYMAQPEEIASSALFLASADARYVNGVELMVDGGLSQI